MKYVGSKQRLSAQIVPLIHRGIEAASSSLYIEPFVGGANIIDKISAPCKIGADNDKFLIELLNAAKGGQEIPETITREQYDAVRQNMAAFPEWYVGLVGFCASYNAKFFGGYANGVHTKIGTIRNYTDEAIRNLKQQAPRLSDSALLCCDYRQWSGFKGATIYCDPPYAGVTGYGGKAFNSAEFFEWCRMMGRQNVVVVSEYEAPSDFYEVEGFELTTTLDKKQKLKRTERIYTIGIGADLFREVVA
ncbi:MAG: DNA adenine methylase [Clostridiaceae bacterium]|nr:DNA adenine methylase [Clostridiaceae bacterium]